MASLAYQLGRHQHPTAARLYIKHGDITTFVGDALVNAANERMLGGGGVDGAIHRAAGPQLRQACETVQPVQGRSTVRCPTGEARITSGNFGDLHVHHVIHTVGPVYENDEVSAPLLEAAYKNSMQRAFDSGSTKNIAFPAISCGVYGYPLDTAARIAVRTVQDAIASSTNSSVVEKVYFYLFGVAEVQAWKRAADEMLTRLVDE